MLDKVLSKVPWYIWHNLASMYLPFLHPPQKKNSRELTYPTFAKRKSSFKSALVCDMLVS